MTNQTDAGAGHQRGDASDWDATTYDRIADPMTRWGVAVLDRLHLDGHERVLDAGCGSGRVTEHLCQRVPRGAVIALDRSAAMLVEARRRLASSADRVSFARANLAQPLPFSPVDAVFSTATFHWIHDHGALFSNLAAVLRPGGQLVAQCGGAGNIARVHAAAKAAGVDLDPTHFATPAETQQRLKAAGFIDVQCWLQPEPTTLAPGEPLETYLRTVCLRQHLDQLPEQDRTPFLHAVMQQLGEPVIDYVRLNILARRGAVS
ncbi:class I SAM-dependent methyltransferase [Thiorhodococcus minor]|uniref:Methyltransferase domain-containing protein n=1 Tax=Thiorhodococcus minor TaxID=57489 RepID=A0A6M0K135_9GAMM|nr:methyltransferase domain-containing protein [Thiorhodococcus minor]NEV62317.1 methyltransferase domain-containing protein [Thiorhodococcus minor]